MIIQDVLDLARFSELSAVNVKDNDTALLLFMNAAMLELYKRFPIKVKEHIIPLVEGTTIYSLPSDYLYVLAAYDEIAEEDILTPAPEIPINEEDNPYSIFFPNHTEVQIPLVSGGSNISVIYVAKPVRYTTDDLNEELDLPETLIEPLMQYMAYKAHSGISSGIQDENNVHYQRFERSCNKARELGVAYPLDSWAMPNRIIDRGFA